LLPEHHSNERGFWELWPAVQINEQILQTLHSAWYHPWPLPAQWWQAESLQPLRQALAEVLSQHFGQSLRWGLKDPRLCRLLPLWIPLVEQFGCTPQFVLMVRHPYEVAASLKQRNKFTHSLSLWLWLEYVLTSIEETKSYPRVIVTYDELLHDWQSTVTKIATQFATPWPVAPDRVAPVIQAFLSPQLKHHQVLTTELMENSEEPLPTWSLQVYQILTTAAQGDYHAWSELTSIRSKLADYVRSQYRLRDKNYQRWCQHQSTRRSFHWPALSILSQPLDQLPRFYLILRVTPQREKYLPATLQSLQAQWYPHWQTFIWSESESKTCLGLPAPSDWIALIDAGDTVDSHCLLTCVRYLKLHPQWRFLYTDEDMVTPYGEPYAPQFKPDFNLDTLRSSLYIGNLALVQGEAWQQVGGYSDYPLLENADLALKILDQYGETAIGHLPQILYHRSMVTDEAPPQADQALAILQQHLQRNGIVGQVYETDFPLIYYIEYPLISTPMVSIMVATTDQDLTTFKKLSNLNVTTYPNYEVILLPYQNLPNLTLAKLYNLAAAQADGQFLLFLHEGTEIIQPTWLEELVRLGQRPEVGIVGARVLGADHRVQQAGFILGMGSVGIAGQLHQGLHHDELGYLGRAQTVQNLSAVSEVGMLVAKSRYLEVGGMEESLQLFNEIDFCLKVRETGQKIVWTPFATILATSLPPTIQTQGALKCSNNSTTPNPSLVRRGDSTPSKELESGIYSVEGEPTAAPQVNDLLAKELAWMYQRWLPLLSRDPAYHPQLYLNGPAWQPDPQLSVPWDETGHDRPRIVAFPYDAWGCGEYRVRAPLRLLQKLGKIDYALMPNDNEGRVPTLTELVRLAPDVVWLHNTLHHAQLQALAQYQRFDSSFKIFGQDDLSFSLPKSNPYQRLNYRDLKSRIIKAISHCHRLIVTTEPLAEVYQYVAEDIVIIPNYLEGHRWPTVSAPRGVGRKPRVGWAGAAQHEGDLQLLSLAVTELADKVEWVFFGMCPDALRPYLTEYHAMVTFDQYPSKLASLNLDLALAPLEYHPFNEAKSNLRLLEYGILGWPVIASDILPYQAAPVTRVKQNTPAAWLTAIQEHLSDLEANQQMGEILKQWVVKHWLLENHIMEWENALLPSPPAPLPKGEGRKPVLPPVSPLPLGEGPGVRANH